MYFPPNILAPKESRRTEKCELEKSTTFSVQKGGRDARSGAVLRMQTKISSFFQPSSAPKSPPIFYDDDDGDNEPTPFSDKEEPPIFGGGDEMVSFWEKEPEVVITYKRRAPNPDRYDAVLLPLDFASFGCLCIRFWSLIFDVLVSHFFSRVCLVAEKMWDSGRNC